MFMLWEILWEKRKSSYFGEYLLIHLELGTLWNYSKMPAVDITWFPVVRRHCDQHTHYHLWEAGKATLFLLFTKRAASLDNIFVEQQEVSHQCVQWLSCWVYLLSSYKGRENTQVSFMVKYKILNMPFTFNVYTIKRLVLQKFNFNVYFENKNIIHTCMK